LAILHEGRISQPAECSIEGVLMGETFDGIVIEGVDEVRIVGNDDE
jgi:hypothetical protein